MPSEVIVRKGTTGNDTKSFTRMPYLAVYWTVLRLVSFPTPQNRKEVLKNVFILKCLLINNVGDIFKSR